MQIQLDAGYCSLDGGQMQVRSRANSPVVDFEMISEVYQTDVQFKQKAQIQL